MNIVTQCAIKYFRPLLLLICRFRPSCRYSNSRMYDKKFNRLILFWRIYLFFFRLKFVYCAGANSMALAFENVAIGMINYMVPLVNIAIDPTRRELFECEGALMLTFFIFRKFGLAFNVSHFKFEKMIIGFYCITLHIFVLFCQDFISLCT